MKLHSLEIFYHLTIWSFQFEGRKYILGHDKINNKISMRTSFFLFVIIFYHSILFSQSDFFIRGKVIDASSNQPLPFANIRVDNTSLGTSANAEGNYELKLAKGKYNLIVSYIGFISDTVSINLDSDKSAINFSLFQSEVDLPEIVILPGENPALEIIRKAILKKHERKLKINSYEFESYTKGLVRSQNEISAGSNSVGIGIGTDSSELKITGILENQSKGYFKQPDNFKEIILARKQSSNFPASINILTGGRFIQNFYDDDVNFFGSDLPGPLAENALDYYYFYIQKTFAIDDKRVFQIYMSPNDKDDPGFEGSIFITDSTFDLIKVDVQLNRTANTGGILDTNNIFQQFSLFDESVYMPVDYRLFIKVNFMGLAKFGFEMNTILYNYKINSSFGDEIFNKAIITVLPEADEKDSTYWLTSQTIPNTTEEQLAYERIDSIKNVPVYFWNDFSIFSTKINLSENASISAPLGMYHFNRIEGHAIDYGLWLFELNNRRINMSLNTGYGFSDKKFKWNFNSKVLFGDYRTIKLNLNLYNKLKILFDNSENYNELTSTLLSLISKYEFRDYYYSQGGGINLDGEFFPVLKLRLGFDHSKDLTAKNKTNVSLFYDNKTYRSNLPINEVTINSVSSGFTIDFRDYIEDGYFRNRVSFGKSFVLLSGDITYSSENLLKSDFDFTTYELKLRGTLQNLRNSSLRFLVYGMYNDGTLPYQKLFSLPGNIDLTSQEFTFRTLNLNQVVGEKALTINLEQNWYDEIFKTLNIPFLNTLQLQLNTFINMAIVETGENTSSIVPNRINSFPHPFYEAGFGIAHPLIPLKIEFAWKLNYRGENNFRVGISSFIF